MGELKVDETKIEVVDGKIVIHRVMEEHFDPEEYLRKVSKEEGELAQAKEMVSFKERVVTEWCAKKKEAEVLWEENMKKADAEAQAAAEKAEKEKEQKKDEDSDSSTA